MKILNLKYCFFLVTLASCSSNYNFLKEIPQEKTPLITSVNYTNYQPKKHLSKRKLKKMQLHKIFSEDEIQNKKNKFNIISKPIISKKFESFIVVSDINNNMLSAVLINYTEKFKLIDYKLVSFIETADRITKTTSEIYKDSIISKEYNLYTDNKPSVLRFQIKKNGTIERK